MVEEQFITSVAENSIAAPVDTMGTQTPAKQKLPAVLGTKELAVFLLLIIVFISNEIYNVLLASASALWALSTAFLCLFVFWLTYRRMRKAKTSRAHRLFVLAISLVGAISSGIGIWATFTSSWLPTLLT